MEYFSTLRRMSVECLMKLYKVPTHWPYLTSEQIVMSLQYLNTSGGIFLDDINTEHRGLLWLTYTLGIKDNIYTSIEFPSRCMFQVEVFFGEGDDYNLGRLYDGIDMGVDLQRMRDYLYHFSQSYTF